MIAETFLETKTISDISKRHLVKIANKFGEHGASESVAAKSYRAMLAFYYNLIIPANASVLEIGCGDGGMLARINCNQKSGIDLVASNIRKASERMPHGSFYQQAGETLNLDQKFDYIIVSDTLNYAADAQMLLQNLRSVSHSETRLTFNFHNTLWRPLLHLARSFGISRSMPLNSWLSKNDVNTLIGLAGWEIIKFDCRLLCPVTLGVLSPIERIVNRYLAPFLPMFCLAIFGVARLRDQKRTAATVSVIVPARNEAGNIEAAVTRTPEMGLWTEIIFVEGHSVDETWTEIQRVARKYPNKRIKLRQQSGLGKGNAVREGFDLAEGDILMILDADLTMPPEELPKFYEAVVSGYCEMGNGCRLIYPMENEAMRFLNLCANKTFSIAFSWLLNQPIKDSLCGTKVLTRKNYGKLASNRAYFGEFDPFGDFDLLFGAGKLDLKIADIPIRYQDRSYGSTNIHRWRHGWLLVKMVAFAAKKLKFI